jgi:hypothetical protein
MFKLAALILALISASEQTSIPRAGIMATAGGRGVLAIEGPILAAGTTITLVTIDVDKPQQVSWAAITDQLTDSEIMAKHDVPGPYYVITAAPASSSLPSLAVAIVGRFEVERRGSAVELRSAKTLNPISVRGCTSSEGLHLAVWPGEPLKGKRLWHKYYYLGYDVEPTCQPADYQGSD